MKALGHHSDTASKSLGSLDTALVRTQHSGGEPSAFGQIRNFVVGGLIERGVAGLASLAVGAARAAGEFAMFGQDSRFALDMLGKGHGVAGEQLFEHASALAVRFGLDLKDTTAAYTGLLAKQFNPAAADDIIRMGTDLKTLGADAEGVKGIFTAIGQIKAKGKFQAEEGMQLAERGLSMGSVQDEIGKTLGKSRAEVGKLMQAGQIDAETAITAIEKSVMTTLGTSKLGEAGAKAADTTIHGLLGRLDALKDTTGVKVTDKLTSPFTKLAGQGVSKVEGFLASPEGVATIDQISAALGKGAELAGKFGESFGSGFGDTIGAIGKSFQPLLDSLGGPAGKGAGEIIGSIGKHLGEVVGLALGVAGAFGALTLGAIVLGDSLITGVGKGFDWFIAKIGDAILWGEDLGARIRRWGGDLLDSTIKIGKNIITGLGDGISSMLSYPIDAAKGVASGVVDTLKGVLGIHSPSKVTGALGENAGESFGAGISRQMGDVSARSAELGRAHVDGLLGASHAGSLAGASWASPAATASSVASTSELLSPVSSTRLPSIDSTRFSGGAPKTFSATFNVTLQGTGNTEEDAEVFEHVVERRMEDWFRQLEMET